ncbi:hypothetical protein CL673_06060 [Candidatus Bathyarchaeota archaeon]|jgi:hypothetical protein|nr:hypothetical protein [Candidatus Bathyarchaeota archaeon]MDP6048237.1 hypothetical protein [Candidatus Bathyarchaeota archaeon]MDP7443088.1 hypothetical protein [Candidatus Bathyarchaeota archaeon]|tara:strand:+ start:3854 stop:4183 length:330 start_codon:yes stop_codon:yes gene_type:complete
MPNGLNHRQDGGNLGNSENGCSEDLDPLDELFQLDNIMCTALEKEALVLLTQLFQNIEEYYALRGQINDVMVKDHVLKDRIKGLLDSLIKGLLMEQIYLGKEFTGVTTL